MSLQSLFGSDPPVPIPPPPSDTILWLNEQVKEAEAFLQAQPGYSKIDAAIKAVMSLDEADSFDPRAKLSKTRTNRIGYIAEAIAAMMTDTKTFWDYQVQNRRFEKHAENYGKLSTFWYQKQSADMTCADLARWYCAAGTAFLYKSWDPDEGDIVVRALDPRNVLPIHPRDYKSTESCRGIIIRERVPVSYIKDRYNLTVSPDAGDASATTLRTSGASSDQDIISPIHKFAKMSKSNETPQKIPTVWLYTCWLKDPRTNDTKKPVEMGEFKDSPTGDVVPDYESPTGFKIKRIPATNWSYLVQPGDQLFPNRRMIVWCGTNIIYDGPSYYWHGRFPVMKFTLQPQPWSWLGKAPIWDILRLQQSLNKLLRVIDDHCEQVANPGSIHDKNNVSKADFDNFDTRRAGYKIRQNPLAGKGIQVIQPTPLDAAVWKHLEWIINEMDVLAGTRDLTQLTRLNQMPSNDTVEDLLNSMTPGIRLRSRIMEAFMREWATQLTYDFSQFYTLPMRVTILGPGSVTQDDFDFDPGSLIPDCLHYTGPEPHGTCAECLITGPQPRYDRAREFLRRITFKVNPGSLLSSAQLEQKMIYLQLARAGWMDIFTLWEVMGIPNIGTLPDNVHTIPERLLYQSEIGLNGQVNSAGRKATGQDTPRIVTKESS